MFSFLVTLQRYKIIVRPQWKLTLLTQLFLIVKNVNLFSNLIFFNYLYGRKINIGTKKLPFLGSSLISAEHHLSLGAFYAPCYISLSLSLIRSRIGISPTCDLDTIFSYQSIPQLCTCGKIHCVCQLYNTRKQNPRCLRS